MIINHNLNAMNAHRNMGINTVNSGKSMEKLASGLRINRAGDDAAGLAISEKMRGQIRGLDQAGRNAQDGISMIQTAEGALNETHSILQRMRELAVQSSNDTNTSVDRGEIQKEINQLTSEINRIGSNTEFNTQKLLSGNKTGSQIKLGDTIEGTQGQYKIALSGLFTTGKKITIDTVDLTAGGTEDTGTGVFDNDGTAAAQAVSLKAVIEGNVTLNAKYTVAVDGNDIILTQKTNSVTGPAVSDDAAEDATLSTILAGTDDTVAGANDVKDGAAYLQIGANQSQQFKVEIGDMRAAALGIAGTQNGNAAVSGAKFAATGNGEVDNDTTAGEQALNVSSASFATAAVKVLDNAIEKVSSERSKLGAYQNRLEHTIANLGTASENLTSAESRIRDVDMAKEMMSFSKNNILSQAAQAMLAQANQQPQGVLQLLR